MRFHYCLSSDSYTLDDLDWFGGGGAVGCKLESGTLSCGEEIRTFNRPGYEPEINPDVTKYLVALITILDADENIVFRTWGMSEINWKTE